ncbi:transposable element Tc1 transposase [Trichonephila clavipes]|nr:transposable element Tc1 transposase [Trichonephila clavipes]
MVNTSVALRFRIPFNDWKKMPRHRILAYYDQLSKFERGRIIGLKEAVCTNRCVIFIWAEAMRLLEDANKNGDESFHLCPDYHRRRVWGRPGQRADLTFTIARHIGPQPGVMVWSAISFGSRTPLFIIRGIVTSHRYVGGILRTDLLPFLLSVP